ncbi:MAG: DnaA/Hda family protein, partial [Phycisphaerales bacterium]|nr:DnaA/Hda family protein [Phycisphaerales bacterium]
MAVIDARVMRSVLEHLWDQHPSDCRHWFNDIEAVDMDGGTIRFLVQEPVQLRYLQRRCTDQFTEATQVATGRLLGIEFITPKDLVNHTPSNDVVTGTSIRTEHEGGMLLSPDYTFESFVVGPDNRLAHAAASAVAQQPGRAYNPFFVHGSVGLGKTHLLQAICQQSMRNNPDMRIYYTSCNAFMNQFLEAVQDGDMGSFRHRFRNYDLLVVDDIHDLSKRDTSQEEFFHT